LDQLRERNVMGSAFGEHTVRFCTHWNIDDEDIETAIERARDI